MIEDLSYLNPPHSRRVSENVKRALAAQKPAQKRRLARQHREAGRANAEISERRK